MQTKIAHLKIKNKPLEPYEILKNKSNRISWNGLSDSEKFLDKEILMDWFVLLRNYSEDTVKAVVIDGLLENQFHKVTFILQLAMAPDFQLLGSKQVYELLYDFVSRTPKSVLAWIDEKDYQMSRDVLALLSRNR